MDDADRTASLMTPAKLAQLQVRPRPAATPAAWLDQLAADAGSGRARRLVDLRRALEAQARDCDCTALQAALAALAEAAGQVDFALVQPKGWLARATGRGKEEAAAFAGQVERVGRAGEDVRDEWRGQQRKAQLHHTAADRTLVEFDVEVKAIEKIIDQGARWLQDMRNQIKAREHLGGDAPVQRQIEEDAARCELLVARLKVLRACTSAAQQAAERCKAAALRRAAVLAAVQQLLEGECEAWLGAAAPLASQARGGGVAESAVEAARGSAGSLRDAAAQAAQDCAQLQAHEQALADELAALHAPLQAAA